MRGKIQLEKVQSDPGSRTTMTMFVYPGSGPMQDFFFLSKCLTRINPNVITLQTNQEPPASVIRSYRSS